MSDKEYCMTGRWVDGTWKNWPWVEQLSRLKGQNKKLEAENKRLNAFMECVIEDLETHLFGIDDKVEQRNINRFIIDIKQNLSKP